MASGVYYKLLGTSLPCSPGQIQCLLEEVRLLVYCAPFDGYRLRKQAFNHLLTAHIGWSVYVTLPSDNKHVYISFGMRTVVRAHIVSRLSSHQPEVKNLLKVTMAFRFVHLNVWCAAAGGSWPFLGWTVRWASCLWKNHPTLATGIIKMCWTEKSSDLDYFKMQLIISNTPDAYIV